jgi:hypothetical protein
MTPDSGYVKSKCFNLAIWATARFGSVHRRTHLAGDRRLDLLRHPAAPSSSAAGLGLILEQPEGVFNLGNYPPAPSGSLPPAGPPPGPAFPEDAPGLTLGEQAGASSAKRRPWATGCSAAAGIATT